MASSSSEHPQVDGSESSPDTEPSIVAAPNLGVGDDGKAPTQSSMHKAARYLSRRGRITCGRVEEGAKENGGTNQVRIDSFEVCVRESLGVLLATRLVLGVLLARHGRRELRGNTRRGGGVGGPMCASGVCSCSPERRGV